MDEPKDFVLVEELTLLEPPSPSFVGTPPGAGGSGTFLISKTKAQQLTPGGVAAIGTHSSSGSGSSTPSSVSKRILKDNELVYAVQTTCKGVGRFLLQRRDIAEKEQEVQY